MRISLAFLVAIAVLAAAACAGGGASPSGAASAEPAEASPSAEESASAAASESPSEEASPSGAAAGDETVTVVESDFGEILADADGNVLYGFTDDTAGEPTCYESCAENWPPLLLEGGEITVGEGLDPADFSTVERTDGGEQVKVGDWPLYYFAADTAPGDTNGQGVGGKWYVVGTDGELIRE